MAPKKKSKKQQQNPLKIGNYPLVETFPIETSSTRGLSSKERNYILSRISKDPYQYERLKSLANDAIKSKKIFTIYGNKSCNPIREALSERGWIEKLPPPKMNLAKIVNGMHNKKAEIDELKKILLSSLVGKYRAKFTWRTKNIIDRDMDECTDKHFIYNKLKFGTLWTTKEGLSNILDRNHWFYEEGVADVLGPRTYVIRDSDDLAEFINDYKITACTSLLNWIIDMSISGKPIYSESGKISSNIIVFALNRCNEYLYHKQHLDMDLLSFNNITIEQWDSYIYKHNKLVSEEETFNASILMNFQLYINIAKSLLMDIEIYRSQVNCEGFRNIWIIKPTCLSRGIGIKIATGLSIIRNLLDNTNNTYVIQKYIEQPLLIHDTKFDIRLYYLVSSIYPLVIWSYRDCYLKFSSQLYNLKDFHESIHLTNNAIQRHYKNCIDRHPDLPSSNMWKLETFLSYLNGLGKPDVWDKTIYPAMKRSIVGVMLNCQDSIPMSKNRFELYGCDFILDKRYKPWLIEINSSPDLAATTHVTADLCPKLLKDLIKVVIDNNEDPKALTGDFECIYRQSITFPHYCGTNLIIRGYGIL